jgi:gliding-associated putative ABC transporter substrate-binding component GldG
MTQRHKTRKDHILQYLLTVAIIVLVVLITGSLSLRFDLTEDKRYTLSEPTVRILDRIDEDIYIQVFLDGEMPVPLRKLRRSVMELLEEFRIASDRHIYYEFINPSEADDASRREAFYLELYEKGLNPVNLQASDEEGGRTQKYIFPGMLINFNTVEVPLNFLRNNLLYSYEQNLLNSIEGLEYELIKTISTITSDTVYKVAFIEGHGEYDDYEVADITRHLARYFTVDRGVIGGKQGILNEYSAIIIAGPTQEFNEADKLVIDQYIMNGGKSLWLLDEVNVNTDSLVSGRTIGFYRPLNLADQLFRYGVRINPVIVQDLLDHGLITLSVSTGADQKQIVPAPWLYYPLLTPDPHHPLTRNLNKIWARYASAIDTVGLDNSVKKTILLSTSQYSRTISPPALIDLHEADQLPDEKLFLKGNLPVAILLEGEFTSAFRNRMISSLTGDAGFRMKEKSSPTRMIVIADGDLIRNELRGSGNRQEIIPLGQDKYTGQSFGNRDFIINCLNYLVDNDGLMELRSRELKLRLLNRQRIRDEKIFWQLLNTTGPVLIVILAGLIFNFFRKRAYSVKR